jgi:hypothetical protein
MKTILSLIVLLLVSISTAQLQPPSAQVQPPTKAKQIHPTKNHKRKTASGSSVSLSCNAPTSGTKPTGYNFYRGTTSGGPYTKLGTATTCAYIDTTVANSTTYYYVATSVSTASSPPESGYSNQVSATIPAGSTTPNSPSGLTVGTITGKNVPLTWTAPSSQAANVVIAYQLYRGVAPNLPGPTLIAILPSSQTSYTDTGCALAQCYYEIKAYDINNAKSYLLTAASNIVEAVM